MRIFTWRNDTFSLGVDLNKKHPQREKPHSIPWSFPVFLDIGGKPSIFNVYFDYECPPTEEDFEKKGDDCVCLLRAKPISFSFSVEVNTISGDKKEEVFAMRMAKEECVKDDRVLLVVYLKPKPQKRYHVGEIVPQQGFCEVVAGDVETLMCSSLQSEQGNRFGGGVFVLPKESAILVHTEDVSRDEEKFLIFHDEEGVVRGLPYLEALKTFEFLEGLEV